MIPPCIMKTSVGTSLHLADMTANIALIQAMIIDSMVPVKYSFPLGLVAPNMKLGWETKTDPATIPRHSRSSKRDGLFLKDGFHEER